MAGRGQSGGSHGAPPAGDQQQQELPGTGADQTQTQAPAPPPAPAPLTGIAAALAALRENFDESAATLWKTKGPRNSHQTEIAGILCEVGDSRRVIIAVGLSSGGFKLYAELPGKQPDVQLKHLAERFGVTLEAKPEPAGGETGGEPQE